MRGIRFTLWSGEKRRRCSRRMGKGRRVRALAPALCSTAEFFCAALQLETNAALTGTWVHFSLFAGIRTSSWRHTAGRHKSCPFLVHVSGARLRTLEERGLTTPQTDHRVFPLLCFLPHRSSWPTARGSSALPSSITPTSCPPTALG